MEDKDFIEKLEVFLLPLFLIIGIALVFLNAPKIDATNLITVISILLGFLAIFYPLVIKKEVAEKRGLLIKEKFKEISKKIGKKLSESDKMINDHDYLSIEKNIEEMSNSLNDFSDLNLRADIDKHLFHAVISLILSLLLFLDILILPSFNVRGFYVLNSVIISLFVYGSYRSIKVIYSWRAIVSKK